MIPSSYYRNFLMALCFISLAVSACKQPTNATETVDPNTASFKNIKQHIFKHSCSSSGCHNTAAASNIQHGLVLEGVDVYERLVGIAPQNADAKNANLQLVYVGKSDSSFLFHKVNWAANTQYRFGNEMPISADALSANEITFISRCAQNRCGCGLYFIESRLSKNFIF